MKLEKSRGSGGGLKVGSESGGGLAEMIQELKIHCEMKKSVVEGSERGGVGWSGGCECYCEIEKIIGRGEEGSAWGRSVEGFWGRGRGFGGCEPRIEGMLQIGAVKHVYAAKLFIADRSKAVALFWFSVACFGVTVSVTFHFMCVYFIFNSVAE